MPEDTTARDALERSLQARLLMCSRDELRVLDVLLVRLELGRERYGMLDLSRPRDWEAERAEELADAAIYEAARVLVDRDERSRRILSQLDESLVPHERASLIEIGIEDINP